MSKNTDYIHQLMTEKLAGVIDAMDEAYLDELIEADPTISKTWKLMQESIVTRNDNTTKSFILLGMLKIGVLKNHKFLVAAMLTTVLFASSYFVWHLTHDTQKSLNKIRELGQASLVQLRLSDGTIINLSDSLDTLQVGNTRLSTANRTLVFSANTSLPVGINTITVPIGQTYHVALPDGSNVWLNSSTEMRFPTVFSDASREIVVKGEAYLEVAPNAAKSFLVDAGSTTIHVLGTAFNINNYDSAAVKVSLVNGSVKIKTALEDKKLKPGEQAILYPDTLTIIQEFDAERELAWREGIYYFTDASLKEICQVIPRWFGNRVEIIDNTISKQRFTGRMQRDLPITQFLETLKATSYVQYEIDKSGTIHFK